MGLVGCPVCEGPLSKYMGCLLVWEVPERDEVMARKAVGKACPAHEESQQQYVIQRTVEEIGDRGIVATEWITGTSVDDTVAQLMAMQNELLDRSKLKWRRLRHINAENPL